ncbi:hypothetical protein F9278_20480 [Streptomyces phaeolivaceus]|uniref:Lipoprotein n=1 Tax=Streptomyces phaeolivaceus TaxID=2653200 RepID=A0A5P8K586_9ACTN|nr:hypothetical protein [Streptomyces phaeolivaceus]QFQ98186.1 hypothetical protein F9278_20480 [Streptomyces phaeolivaceus]
MSRISLASPRSRRTLTALTLLSAAVLLSTTACSSEPGGDTSAQTRHPERPAKATPAAETDDTENTTDTEDETDTPRELAKRAPDPFADRVVLRQDRTRNSAHLEFDAARKGDGKTLSVAVSCEGEGTIEVALRPLAASFPMDCLDGEVTSINNEFTMDGTERAGTVSVTASTGVQWSLSIGRGEPSEQDPDD